MHPIFERHLDELRHAGITVESQALGSGALLLRVPQVSLPPGWNQPTTDVRFLVPSGYPFAAPDCFFTEPGLRLANQLEPQSSALQQLPELAEQGRWFSWHVTQWNPNRDSLLTFFRLIRQRLQTAQ